MSVELVTSMGTIELELYTRECPRTCRNFLELAKSGYYDGILFHRVVKDFMIQTGDPLGDGSGGESIYGPTFDDEVIGRLDHGEAGVLSMANAGRNTNSSQFFLTFKACPHLDGKHTIFGRVVSGTGPGSVLEEMSMVKIDKNSRPKVPIKLFSVHITRDPWNDQPLPPGCIIPDKPLVSINKSWGKKKSFFGKLFKP